MRTLSASGRHYSTPRYETSTLYMTEARRQGAWTGMEVGTRFRDSSKEYAAIQGPQRYLVAPGMRTGCIGPVALPRSWSAHASALPLERAPAPETEQKAEVAPSWSSRDARAKLDGITAPRTSTPPPYLLTRRERRMQETLEELRTLNSLVRRRQQTYEFARCTLLTAHHQQDCLEGELQIES